MRVSNIILFDVITGVHQKGVQAHTGESQHYSPPCTHAVLLINGSEPVFRPLCTACKTCYVHSSDYGYSKCSHNCQAKS